MKARTYFSPERKTAYDEHPKCKTRYPKTIILLLGGFFKTFLQTLFFVYLWLSSFTRFLGQNVWAMEEVAETALEQFFHTLRIKPHSVLFLIVDDTIVRKSGKKIPGCAWHRDHAQKAYVFGHQWVLSALLYKDFLLPLWAKLYHPKGTKGCGSFQTKITMAKKMLQALRLPIPCKLYLLADSWYWTKQLAQLCRKYGYHMISQLKSTSVLFLEGKKTKVTTLSTIHAAYREVFLFVYGKNKTLKIARFVGIIQGLGEVAVVVVKEKRKKDSYLVSTNLHLSALDIVKYYAKRWKIEQMIKDLKQRLGFGHYQVRNPQAIHRHVALASEDPPMVKRQNGFFGCIHPPFSLPSTKAHFAKPYYGCTE
ncbi:MAG: transposase [Thermodesulfobacteriota bacterium]